MTLSADQLREIVLTKRGVSDPVVDQMEHILGYISARKSENKWYRTMDGDLIAVPLHFWKDKKDYIRPSFFYEKNITCRTIYKGDLTPVASINLKSTFLAPLNKKPKIGMDVWCIDPSCCGINNNYIGIISSYEYGNIGVNFTKGDYFYQVGCHRCLIPVTMLIEKITPEAIEEQKKALMQKCEHGIYKMTCPHCYEELDL